MSENMINDTAPLMDQQQKLRLSSTEVNMINCYKQREDFFERYSSAEKKIHLDVLIAYWIMSGFLGPVDSVDKAYKRGRGVLQDLIKEGTLKLSDEDCEMVELARLTGNSKTIQCRHEGYVCAATGRLEVLDLLDVNRIENVVLADGMLKKRRGSADDDWNYLSRQVFESDRGRKYIAHFNPTPISIKPLVDNDRNPSVLILRGCDQIFPVRNLTFEKYKTLTVLEISGSGLFTAVSVEEVISKLTQLQSLSLSDPLLDKLPTYTFSDVPYLRRLSLRGCSSLSLDSYDPNLKHLEMLDLSYTSRYVMAHKYTSELTHLFLTDTEIEASIQFFAPALKVLDVSRTESDSLYFVGNQNKYSHLILKECSRLEELPTMKYMTDLEVLDVSGCIKLCGLPEDLGELKNMKELNLSGCSLLGNLRDGLFDQMSCLLKLDLSETKVRHLPSFSTLTSLHKLSLRGLELDSLEVETWSSLSNLAELDLCGLVISSSQELELDFLQSLGNLQILNLSKTSVTKLPDISMLRNLKELLLADCRYLKFMPDLQPLRNLEILDLSLPDDSAAKICLLQVEPNAQTVLPHRLRRVLLRNRPDVIDFVGIPSSSKGSVQEERTISEPVQIHVVYDISNQLSVFDQFFYEFERLGALIIDIQRNSSLVNNNQASYFKKPFKMLHADLKYIQENTDRLKGSRNCKSSEKLLQELLDAATHLSTADFKDNSLNLKQLLRAVIKLKLMLPPSTQTDAQDVSNTTKRKEQPLFTKSVNEQSLITDINEESSIVQCPQEICDDLYFAYQSLTETQKKCLLCFAAFPCNEEEKDESGVLKKSLVIKKRILIYWWVGEGFIDPQNAVALEDFKSTKDGDLALHRNQNLTGKPKSESSDANMIQMGNKMLEVLARFIKPVIRKRRETGSCRMHYSVHSFITAQAKVEGFFDFKKDNRKLTPYLTRSKNSSKLEAKSTKSQKELEILRDVLTLFNVNGSVINIKPEWFSIMKNLSVLYLGSWNCSENANQVEIADDQFLEELKKMKKLKLFSLQGLQTIRKLPDSLCKMNLKILDFRDCINLEELPADIGSLKNLTHLDITNCLVLYKMPKGISLLSKLELLKGFKITKNHEAKGCSLRDLLSLQKLRNLSLVVNMKSFPSDDDAMVFELMKSLGKLKILWERSLSFEQDEEEHQMLRETRCFYPRGLEKLELWCFPYKIAPRWLHPSGFTNIKKLYIVGGSLEQLSYATHDKITSIDRWRMLETLRLKYLRNLHMSEYEVKRLFPGIQYLEWHECGSYISSRNPDFIVECE